MTELRKPDMPAVLERTNLASGFDGFMLPIFEAGSNSIHSILGKYGVDKSAVDGRLTFIIDTGTGPEDFSVQVLDNGLGLNEENMRAFITPFTGHKLRRGGKGFGRFIAFKVFQDIAYSFRSENPPHQGSFIFDIYQDEELQDVVSGDGVPYDSGCRVKYEGVKRPYDRQVILLDADDILFALTQNFLTYLVDGRMPLTEVVFDGTSHNLRDHFNSVFTHEDSYTFDLEIDDRIWSFQCEVSRVLRGKPFDRHALLFFADSRLLGKGRPIENILGRSFFTNETGDEYVVIASVSGEYLNKHANQARTQLEADEDTIKAIVDKCCENILTTEVEQNDKIKIKQQGDVIALLQSHPLMRFGLSGKTIADYVAKKPNNWSKENFISDLAIQRLREERRWTEFVQETISDKELFQQRKDSLLAKVSTALRDALSEYVVHRKAVIEVADQLRGLDNAGKMSPEDAVHQLIFPRHADSTDTRYYQHNLWLLDERLAFVSYVSSDRTLHGGRRSAGDKVADINFYDECYVTGGSGTSSIVVVEFKRPGRNDYSFGREGSDPIRQIHDTVEIMRARKSFITKDGKTISVPDNTPITAFIVADLEPSLRNVARRYDFSETWDRNGLFKYHEEFDLNIEAFGYDRMLSDAQKRNAPFFEVLLNDIGN